MTTLLCALLILPATVRGDVIRCETHRKMEELHDRIDGVVVPKVVDAGTTFGLNVFRTLAEANREKKNLFISPLSITTALAMVYNGAGGKTKEEMERVLAVNGIAIEELNAAYSTLLRRLSSKDPNSIVSIANSVWVNEPVRIREQFRLVVEELYKAAVESRRFSDKTVQEINDWVAKKTKGMIQKIIDELRPDALVVLVNAIYFEGKWETSFKKDGTFERPFTMGDGSKKNHPLMHQSGMFSYAETDNVQMVSLPYKGGAVAMDIFLPKPSSSLESLERGLTIENYKNLVAPLKMTKRTYGTVAIPKFKAAYERELNKDLIGLGMPTAFSSEMADFSKLTDVPSFISKVIHKAVVEVAEEGTKAAAVTAIIIERSCVIMPPEDAFRMTVDRPFLFAIRDVKTGAILFMGSIYNPEKLVEGNN